MDPVVFYIKKGRRYEAVREYDPQVMDAFPYGDHLVSVYQNGSRRRYSIDAALAPMIAAGRYAEDAISRAILEASQMQPSKKALTPEQIAAWDSLKKAYADEMFFIQWPSAQAAAQAGIDAMIKEADRIMTNPAVKEAYQHFMTLARLAAEQDR
jgi:hypothetical protein